MSLTDQLWVLLCAALIFIMQAGFMCVEAGSTRSKNNISVALKNVTDLSISLLIFWLFGNGLMYGASAWGLIGTTDFFPNAFDDQGMYIVFIFHAMFCGTAATILSGTLAERVSFHGYVIITIITVGLIFPLFGHWVWAKDSLGNAVGWLGALGFYDFAGAAVVHSVGGGVALAAAMVIGPRDGRFLQAGQPRRFNGSNLPLSMLGVLLIWFGWIGFNGGSSLSFDNSVPKSIMNTFISGAAGVVAALGISWSTTGKANVFSGMHGALAGLVAITACSNIVDTREAFVIGAIGGAIAHYGDLLLEKLHIDDAVNAVPVHLFAGAWSVIAVAIFGADSLGTSVQSQFLSQCIGLLVIAIFAVALPFGLIWLVDRIIPLRVSLHIETIGLNVGEHGANTDLNELFEVMKRQARDRDLNVRAPQSPFTEVGQIGLFYNSVIFELEQSFGRIEAKETELRTALEENENVLNRILPKSVAKRMKNGEDQIVDQISDATVVFIDIVDFTKMSVTTPPRESMELLEDIFGRYDAVISKYELEKIKTIGDSYLYVGGVTTDQKDHCAAAVDAALEILFETQQLGIKSGRELKVRIGIHSGPLVAGLVGELRFVYDLWGTTVNIAAHVESASKPGIVTVSEAVIERIGREFNYERQARVRLKGVGPTILYKITGRRQGVE